MAYSNTIQEVRTSRSYKHYVSKHESTIVPRLRSGYPAKITYPLHATQPTAEFAWRNLCRNLSIPITLRTRYDDTTFTLTITPTKSTTGDIPVDQTDVLRLEQLNKKLIEADTYRAEGHKPPNIWQARMGEPGGLWDKEDEMDFVTLLLQHNELAQELGKELLMLDPESGRLTQLSKQEEEARRAAYRSLTEEADQDYGEDGTSGLEDDLFG